MPVGYLWSVGVVALGTLLALRPLRRPWPLGPLSFFFGIVVNELPFVAFCWLLAWTLLALAQGDLSSPVGLAALGVAVLTTTGLVAVAWRGLQAGPAIEQAIGRELGTGRCRASDPPTHPRLPRGYSLARVLLAPFPVWRRDVERIANVNYGDAGRANQLDVYRHRSHPSGAPVLIHFHGGHFRMGAKSREARAIFYRLAGNGWVCASANYRLREAGRFPNSLIDAKKAIAWARRHAAQYDADPTVLVVAGSSAGAHLASMAALTPNDPAFQPGFAGEDTSVSAAVCLYGYYGDRGSTGPLASSPLAYAHANAPRSSLLTAPTTPPYLSTRPHASPNNCEASPPARSSTRNCPARRTSLTCFAPCGWEGSSTGSRPLPPGSITVVQPPGQARQPSPSAEIEQRGCRRLPTLHTHEHRSAPVFISRPSHLGGSNVADPGVCSELATRRSGSRWLSFAGGRRCGCRTRLDVAGVLRGLVCPLDVPGVVWSSRRLSILSSRGRASDGVQKQVCERVGVGAGVGFGVSVEVGDHRVDGALVGDGNDARVESSQRALLLTALGELLLGVGGVLVGAQIESQGAFRATEVVGDLVKEARMDQRD